jgi:hypothetical protein
MLDPCSRSTVAVLIVTFLSSVGHAAVLHVPGDYAHIQDAIDTSGNGDVILVSPGVYSENIDFKGKAITLSSTNPADPNVVVSTIIRASGPSSVVTFAHGESSNAVLMGFTITGGYGTTNPLFGTNYYWGAGIYCYGSSPTILGNIITANFAPQGTASKYGYGGGIGCIESEATIAGNLVAGNSGYAGGGIMTEIGRVRITDNVICSNSAVLGGGALVFNSAQLINNTLVGNGAQFAGNVYAYSDANGLCLISDNIICNATNGGGLYLDGQDTLTRPSFNDVWNNTGGDYVGTSRTGLDGNFSQDPQFVDAGDGDYHLRDASPCINAGDPNLQPAVGESDFYGSARVHYGRVDIGASEYFDTFTPVANAGPDQLVTVTALPTLITLDGSGSADPNGAAITFHWRQLSGPAGSFSNPSMARPVFSASALGTYTFELVVDAGGYSSFADTVQFTLTNQPPTADAGDDQIHSDQQPIASITLDGSRSFDPEHVVLSYHWTQLSGWQVQLSDPNAARPAVLHPWPGTYRFQLVVNDGLQDSKPSVVAVYVGPDQPPVANPGRSRYAGTISVALDGTQSYAPSAVGTLRYQWRQVSGPLVTITGTNTATPVLSGFRPTNSLQTCVFELIVSDGHLVSQPSNVTVTVVRNYGSNTLFLANPPFDPAKPTIVAFNGGNCETGSGMRFGGVWEQQANWITVVDRYGPVYTKYADMLIVYLSSVAPDYRQPIQTMGWSTGNLPAMNLAWYMNQTYKDARYAVNRVSLLDAVCGYLGSMVAQFHTNRVAGEQCWVDNYISNDPKYSAASIIPGALNVVCLPPRDHFYPVSRYGYYSSLDFETGGLTAFAYLSVIGSGKNYQLNTASKKYYFKIDSSESIVFYNQTNYPGKILAPVELTGPLDGHTLSATGATLGCQPVTNAVRYQLLMGSTPDRVMDYTIMSDTTNAPQQTITALPQPQAWWTVRAYDQFESTIYPDPRLLRLPENRPPVANPGPDQVIYAGLDGKATVTLDGSKSTDLDGDALSYTWAWATGGDAFLSHGVALTIDLPVGVHLIQLMANDGKVNSQAAGVKVTVVGPLECQVKIAPSTINLRSEGLHILARVRFPDGFAAADVGSDEPPLLYPGGLQATRWSTANGHSKETSILASFDRGDLSGQAHAGSAEFMVIGKLRSGQVFHGRDTVRILEEGRAK